jgi:Na+/H+-dicarboxylate symporter
LLFFSVFLSPKYLTKKGDSGQIFRFHLRSNDENYHVHHQVYTAGCFAIVSKEVAKNAGSLGNIAGSLGIYMLTVFIGLIIHAGFILPLSIKILGKANPFKYLRNMVIPLLTAFSTSSSNAALPLSMEATEHKNGVSGKLPVLRYLSELLST